VVAQTHIKDVPITNLGDSRIGENTVILEGSLRKVSDNVPATKEDLDRMAEEMERKRNIPLAYTTLARLYKKDKQYKKALVAVNRSLELDANDFWALELRGTIKAKLGDLSGGLSDLNRSLEINPNSQSAIYLERGIIYLMMGDKINAQKDFDKFIEAFPNAKKTLEKRIEEANQQISESTVGVAQCDDYLRKVRSCLMTHLPETALVKL
jgi:tetratricopeptide (TPR) repeat protein